MATLFLHPVITQSSTAIEAFQRFTGLKAFILSPTVCVLRPQGSAPMLTIKPKARASHIDRPYPTGPFNGGGAAA